MYAASSLNITVLFDLHIWLTDIKLFWNDGATIALEMSMGVGDDGILAVP